MEVPVTNTADPTTTTMHTAVSTPEQQQTQTNNVPCNNIQLPKQLEAIKAAHILPLARHRWNTNEEIASILIAFTKHVDWQYHEVKVRPPSGCMLLFNRNKVRYRKDGYCWKKRKDGKTIREDHMKLKVQGLECIYGSYVHSAILPTFHRRCYWLLQNPDIVLVHYLNVPYPNNTKLSIPVMSFAMEKKEWTKQDLIDQLTPMFSSLDGKGIPAIDETILTLVQRLIEHQDQHKQEQSKCSGDADTSHHAQLAGSGEHQIPIQPELAKCSGAAHECLQTNPLSTTNVNVSNTILQQVQDAHNRIDIAQGPLILNLGNIPNGGLMLVTGQNSGTQLSILTNNNTGHASQQQQQQQQWTSVPLTSQQLSQIASFSKTNMQTVSQTTLLKQQQNTTEQMSQNQSSCCNCKPKTNQRQGSSDVMVKPDDLGKASCSHDQGRGCDSCVESNIILQQMEMSSSPMDKVETNLLQSLCEDQTTKPQLHTIDNLDSLVGDLNLDLIGSYKTTATDSSSTQALEHMGDSFESLQASLNTLPGSDITLDHLDLLDIPELEKICTDMSGASQINSQQAQGCDSQRSGLIDMGTNFPSMELSNISASNMTLNNNQGLCSHGYNHVDTTLHNKHVCSTAEGHTTCVTTPTPVAPPVSTYHSGRGDNLVVSNKAATLEGVAMITDFSPDWAYPEGQTKVLVTGPWHTTMGTYTVLLDGKVVATTLVQPGVLRCFVPGHQPGIVMLQVACDGQLVSNTVMFQYKERVGTNKDVDAPHTDWFSVNDTKLQHQLTAKVKHLETALTQVPDNTCVRQILANLASPVDRDICLTRHIETLSGCMWTINNLTIENGSMGLSLLHLAAGLGYHRFIKTLIQWRSDNPSWMLEYEVDAHSSDLNSCTPLMWACARGHTDAAICLYKWNKGLLHSFNREGNLPLFVARLHGHHDLADQLELLDSSCDLSHRLSSSVATSQISVSTTSIYGKEIGLNHDQKLCSDINNTIGSSSVRSTPDKTCFSSNFPIATSTPVSKDVLESDLFKSPPTRSKAGKPLGALHIDIPSKDHNAQTPTQQKREKLTRRQSDQTLKLAPNTAATNYSTSLSTAERRQKLKKRLSVDILPYENSEPVHYSPTTTYQRPIREANSEPHLSANMEHLLCETNPMLSEGRDIGSPEMLMHTEGNEKPRQGTSAIATSASTATVSASTPQPVHMDTDELSDGSNSFIDVEKLSSDDEEDLRSKLTNTVGDGENPNSQMVHLAKQIIAAMPERIKSSPSRCDEALPDEGERERSNSYSSLQSASPHASSYGEALSSYGEDSGISTPMRDSLAFDEYRYSDVYSDLGTPASSLSPDSTCLHSPYSPYNFHLDSPPPTAAEFVEYFNAPATFMEKDFSQLTLSDLEQRKLYEAAKVIQSAYRQYKDKQCKQQAKEIEAAILIQSYYRRYKQYAYYKKMTQAAVLIQSQFRSYYAQKRFKKSRDAAVVIQNQYRSYKEHERLKKGGNKTVIQRYRSHYQRKPAGAGKGSRVVQIVPDGGEGSQAETTSTAIDDCPRDTNSEAPATSHASGSSNETQTHGVDQDHVPQISPYSKLLLTAGCAVEHPSSIYGNTTSFCPGYSDAYRTPLYGVKEKKLKAMSDVFCSSCQYGDHMCDALFCDPSRLIVQIVMTTMNAICETMEHTHVDCYQQFCDGFTSPAGRSSRNKREAPCSQFEPAEKFTGVTGMAEWCQSTCTKGHCPPTHCQCVPENSTTDTNLEQGTKVTSGATMTTGAPTTTTTTFPKISLRSKVSENITVEAGLDVISTIVCEHGKVYQQNQLTNRYCQQEQTVNAETDYGQDLLGQIEAVGPQLMCALTRESNHGETCSSMFCGEDATSAVAIQMSMCSVCGQFSDVLSASCEKTYCI